MISFGSMITKPTSPPIGRPSPGRSRRLSPATPNPGSPMVTVHCGVSWTASSSGSHLDLTQGGAALADFLEEGRILFQRQLARAGQIHPHLRDDAGPRPRRGAPAPPAHPGGG